MSSYMQLCGNTQLLRSKHCMCYGLLSSVVFLAYASTTRGCLVPKGAYKESPLSFILHRTCLGLGFHQVEARKKSKCSTKVKHIISLLCGTICIGVRLVYIFNFSASLLEIIFPVDFGICKVQKSGLSIRKCNKHKKISAQILCTLAVSQRSNTLYFFFFFSSCSFGWCTCPVKVQGP